MFHKMCCN